MRFASLSPRVFSFLLLFLTGLSVNAIAPSIVSQPQDVTVVAGANASFGVSATGSLPLAFQWMKNGVNLSGKTGASLVLTKVTAADSGFYSASVSNADGVTTSASANLTVNPAVATLPTIVSQPLSQTRAAGSSAAFTVEANGSAPLSFQWMKDGLALAGQTGATLTLQNITAADTGNYLVKVSNPQGSVTSSTATLTVTGQVTPVLPSINAQPLGATVAAGGNVSFTVSASGTAPLSFQWVKNGANLNGQNGMTLTLNNVSSADAGNYFVKVSNSAGTVNSAAASLTVSGSAAPTGTTIVTQPVSLTATVGGTASFTVAATGAAPLTYQWLKNGGALTGQTGATLTLKNLAAADAGSYSAQVSNGAGTVLSANATLTVTAGANPTQPTIAAQPVSQIVPVGGTAKFTVSANGSAPLTFQWVRDGANISGQTMTSLTITNVTIDNAGNYFVKVGNAAGTVVSATATLSVTPGTSPLPPTIVTQPVSLIAPAGGTATFQVTANGSAPFNYQWTKDGVDLSGQTSASLTLTNLTALDAANYSVRLSNSAGTATSAKASLTVQSGPGTVDPAYLSAGISNVMALARLGDGSLIVGGSFTNVRGNLRNRLAKLLPDGTLDGAFNLGAGFNGDINSLILQADGKLLVGGKFTSAMGQAAGYVARLTASGNLDAGFMASSGGANNPVEALALQSGGKALIGGEFTAMNGQTQNRLARLNTDGALDPTFNIGAGFNGPVHSLAVQPDGRILAGGGFTSVNGQSHKGLVRLTNDGSVDTTFDSAVAISGGLDVKALGLAGSGQIIVGTSSTLANPVNQTNLARLDANGTLDPSFKAGISGEVNVINVLPSGKILVGGGFQTANDAQANGLVELDADGSVDRSFNAGLSAGGDVMALAVQADGNLIAGSNVELRRLLFDDLVSGATMIASILRANNGTSVTFQTETGNTYFLEFKDDLSASAWLSVGTIVGNGNVQTVSDTTAAGPHRFYRVRQQ